MSDNKIDYLDIINQAKNKGYTDDEILLLFYRMYKDDDFDLNDFKEALSLLGYNITKEFMNLPDEEKKRLGEDGFIS